MKKVLFTATVDSHILQFHIPFLKLFKDNGYEVHVATNGNEVIPYCDVKHVVSFERSPFKLNNLKAIKQLRKICNDEKFDIIHTHTPMGSVVTRLAAKNSRKKYNTRVIYTAHGLHFFKGAPLKNWLMFYPVEKYLAKYTDTLILINHEDYEYCKKSFSKRCFDINYIPGIGIEENKFMNEMSCEKYKKIRESIGLNEKDFVLIFPARLDKNKNQTLLINVMEKLIVRFPDIHLLLPGEDELNGYYQKLTTEKKLEKNIHYLGYVKNISDLLKISDLSVSSSIREGLGLNLAEGNYVGLPIVATKNRGHMDVVKNGVNGFLIELSNEDEFVDKIEMLYNDKELYKKMSENAKRESKKFMLKNVMKEMSKIYEKKN